MRFFFALDANCGLLGESYVFEPSPNTQLQLTPTPLSAFKNTVSRTTSPVLWYGCRRWWINPKCFLVWCQRAPCVMGHEGLKTKTSISGKMGMRAGSSGAWLNVSAILDFQVREHHIGPTHSQCAATQLRVWLTSPTMGFNKCFPEAQNSYYHHLKHCFNSAVCSVCCCS